MFSDGWAKKSFFYLPIIMMALFVLLFCRSAGAVYSEGFNEGPYLRLTGGFLQAKWDNNVRTGGKIGNDYEPCVGFQFGWNLWDWAGPELEVRYTTKKIADRREHIVNINANVKYTFVTNILTGIGGKLEILPFVQGGPAVMLGVLPGDLATTNRIIGVYGAGIGFGSGIDFIIVKNVSLGILLQGDVVHIWPVDQDVNGTQARILAGGWEPTFGFVGAAGVKF